MTCSHDDCDAEAMEDSGLCEVHIEKMVMGLPPSSWQRVCDVHACTRVIKVHAENYLGPIFCEPCIEEAQNRTNQGA